VESTHGDVGRPLTAGDSHDRGQGEVVGVKWRPPIDCVLGESRFGSNGALGGQDRRQEAEDVVRLVTPGESASVCVVMGRWAPCWDEGGSNGDDNGGKDGPMTNGPKTKRRECGEGQGQPCLVSDAVCGECQAKTAESGDREADRSEAREWGKEWGRPKSGDDGGGPKSSSDQDKDKGDEEARPMLGGSEPLSLLQ